MSRLEVKNLTMENIFCVLQQKIEYYPNFSCIKSPLWNFGKTNREPNWETFFYHVNHQNIQMRDKKSRDSTTLLHTWTLSRRREGLIRLRELWTNAREGSEGKEKFKYEIISAWEFYHKYRSLMLENSHRLKIFNFEVNFNEISDIFE